jgi:hypothetical protein
MTSFVTVAARPKRGPCGKHWRRDLRCASYNCTRRKPGSCTARTATGAAVIQSGNSISWGTRFVPEVRRTVRGSCSSVSPQRSAVKQPRRCVSRCDAGSCITATTLPWRTLSSRSGRSFSVGFATMDASGLLPFAKPCVLWITSSCVGRSANTNDFELTS